MIINLSLNLTPVFHIFAAILIFCFTFQFVMAFLWSAQFFDIHGEKFTKKTIVPLDPTYPSYIIFLRSFFSFNFFILMLHESIPEELDKLTLPLILACTYLYLYL